jgi:hypothetical protein
VGVTKKDLTSFSHCGIIGAPTKKTSFNYYLLGAEKKTMTIWSKLVTHFRATQKIVVDLLLWRARADFAEMSTWGAMRTCINIYANVCTKSVRPNESHSHLAFALVNFNDDEKLNQDHNDGANSAD